MSGEIHAFTMPKWGLTMERGTLTAWHKQVGDLVKSGEEVCDVETEKIARTPTSTRRSKSSRRNTCRPNQNTTARPTDPN